MMSLKPRAVAFDEKWEKIEETVTLVLTLGAIKQKYWNERFSDIYALCVAHPDPLADKLYLETKSLLENHVRDLCVKVSAQQDENLLSEYYKHWLKYSTGAKNLNCLYSYLNNQYVQKTKMTEADIMYGGTHSHDSGDRMLEIGELGLDIWQRELIIPLQNRLAALLLACIKQDRCNQNTDSPTTTIRGVIFSFIDVNMFKNKSSLELFENVFEKALILETGEFYSSEASAILQECDVSQYMEKVINRLSEEKLRATKFLPPSSHISVEKEVQTKMIADHLATLHAEAPAMVAQENTRDLGNMYKLLKTVHGGVSVMVKQLQEHIKQKGLQATNNLKGDNVPAQFVESLLKVHQKYMDMIKNLFSNDQQFVGALDKAFESVINHRVTSRNICKSPELLAKYCDSLLKKSTKGLNESEVDDKLAQSITIFKYIDDKDVFQKFYSRHLAKRLIQQQSHSMDSEEAMINKLKQACGYEYTSKLHRMFTDMNISAGHNQKFQEYTSQQKIELGINFSINVLQAGAWPLGQSTLTPFSVPHELEKSVQAFEAFYHKNFSGRKLTWLHHLCQGELKVGFTKRTYLITMSSFQMAMLLVFEKTDSLTCAELQQHTTLNDEQFYKFLQSLIDCKILTASEEALEKTTVLKLNFDYTNKRTKFKITVASPKETQQEVEHTHTSVDEDRKLYLQAAIVRIMKARKVLQHSLLIQEVISQSRVRFIPQVPMIKKCIEVLIDKQYLERSSSSSDQYSYVA
ncbi:UNVERIFIED_CONTAM: hypothetical protein RMT77_002448 [Armadillidium vulgare]